MKTKRRVIAGLLAGLLATVGLGLLSTAGAAPDPGCRAQSCAPDHTEE